MHGEPTWLVSRLRAGMARLARFLLGPRGAASDSPIGVVLAVREPHRGPEIPGAGAAVITRTRAQTKRPSMYRVLLLNDDYTPMEFVIAILQAFFNKNPEEATQIMLHVHNNGVGECGVYTYEIAETKVAQVMDHARKNQHPLQCIMEKK
ncbi:MAG: ATP-dependent Clp protease adapter ClpS [Roseiarcus sp.]